MLASRGPLQRPSSRPLASSALVQEALSFELPGMAEQAVAQRAVVAEEQGLSAAAVSAERLRSVRLAAAEPLEDFLIS